MSQRLVLKKGDIEIREITSDDNVYNALFYNSDKIGVFSSNNRVFTKFCDRERHYFFKFMGYGMSVDILSLLVKFEVKYIRIVEKEKGVHVRDLTFNINLFLESKITFVDTAGKGDVQNIVPEYLRMEDK